MKFLSGSIMKMKKRDKNAHKGDFGRVLVVAGSEDYPGAAVMASAAAESILRSGADYVTVAAPEKVAWAVNKHLPDAVTKKFKYLLFHKYLHCCYRQSIYHKLLLYFYINLI